MALSEELLPILACPRRKGNVILVEEGSSLICPACRRRYLVVDCIPVMSVDLAETVQGD